MKFRPLQDWAVIRPSEAAKTTAGGLFIPDTAKEKPQEGVVEAIGPGALEEEKRHEKKSKKKERLFVPTVVKPGDRVVYGRYAGGTYTIDSEERVLVRERDILGILPGLLQIPAATASAGETALMKAVAKAPAERPKAAKKTVVKKPVAKKAAVKKTAVKKTVAKKTAVNKKSAKKPAAKKKTTAAKTSKTVPAKKSAKGKKAGRKK